MEQARVHPPPERAPSNRISTFALCQANPDSLFGDVPDLDSSKAAEIAADIEKWKSISPSKRC